jgi:hypothetical protein
MEAKTFGGLNDGQFRNVGPTIIGRISDPAALEVRPHQPRRQGLSDWQGAGRAWDTAPRSLAVEPTVAWGSWWGNVFPSTAGVQRVDVRVTEHPVPQLRRRVREAAPLPPGAPTPRSKDR